MTKRNTKRFAFGAVGLLALIFGLSAISCEDDRVVESFPETFVGVGVELRMQGLTPVVVRTLRGGSAEIAGLMSGDRIVAVDGVVTRGKTLGDVVMALRGAPESQVMLDVMRGEREMLVAVRRQKMVRTGKKVQQDYRRQEKRQSRQDRP